jgi:hypothetical protein
VFTSDFLEEENGMKFLNEPPGLENSALHSPDHALRELGIRLRHARLRRNLSASFLASKANISLPTLRHLENGWPSVSIGILFRVFYCLNLEADLQNLATEPQRASLDRDFPLRPRASASHRRAPKNP